MARPERPFQIGIQRFGLGAGPASRDRLGPDIRAALLDEIRAERALIQGEGLPTTARGIQIVTQIEDRRRMERAARRQVAQQAPSAPAMGEVAPGAMASAGMPANPPAAMPDPEAIRLRDILHIDVKARIDHGLAAPAGFAERWVLFWSNHFCIALRRGQIMQGIAGPYEREAIRPHVFGRFADLLVAVETHPAMLHYLDQRQSIGPNSPAGQRRRRGLNENLAREILELHTLGVGGGYNQADVTAFARALTGWSITGFEENIDGYGAFVFAPNRHEPGPQQVLGRSYGQEGKEKGLAILRDLARHPSTARFLATKIARHFVADSPPPALVAALEAEFRKTDGDLAALARVLVTHPASLQPSPAKIRTPYEFLLASLRATGAPADRIPALANALNLMGQPLWNPPGPNGFPDDEASLVAPKAIKTRLEFALQFARPLGGRIDPRDLAEALFGEALSTETRQAIARAETRPQGLALLLMAPEFQRR
ncbi:DUF1800 family protein [Rhabdaerophilum sp. SD176]|uniref:DUF1800 domain-containing protein n=1 Tax=Rhabdaerophilum sp. SD176 TaxID=2983548 RepID=UPI0024DF6178|nr:DUF1800 family protein [Rhabdaerophilum sp. SD176]